MSNNANKTDTNTLGQDLLRMFLDEISTDVVVEVAGRRIKAHKCILTSRCQYFAALLSGGWVESAGNVLSIQGLVSLKTCWFNKVYKRRILKNLWFESDKKNFSPQNFILNYIGLRGGKKIPHTEAHLWQRLTLLTSGQWEVVGQSHLQCIMWIARWLV